MVKNKTFDLKNSLLEPRISTKKIWVMVFIVGILGVLLIGSVSAMDWDNVANYKNNDKTITIKNALGLGSDIVEATITSHSDLSKPIYVGTGYQRVIEIQVESFNEYQNALKSVEFKNMKNDENENLNYYWEKAIYEDVDVNDYKNICEKSKKSNETGLDICRNEIIGTHKENKIIGWEKLDTADLKKGNSTIALVVYVKNGDYYDGKPTLFGKKIDKWASWTSGLTTGLSAYWMMNNTGSVAVDSYSNRNFTIFNNWTTAGIIGAAHIPKGNLGYDTTLSLNGLTAFTISFWINRTVGGSNTGFFSAMSGYGAGDMILAFAGTNNINVNFNGDKGFGTYSVPASVWTHVVLILNASGSYIYQNATLDQADAFTSYAMGNFPLCIETGYNCGGGDNLPGGVYMDEIGVWNRSLSVSEITQLYNNHLGITYLYSESDTTKPNVNITYPLNSSYSDNTLDANYTVNDSIGLSVCKYSIDKLLTNYTMPCGTNITNITWSEGSINLTVWANDTSNNINISSVSFFVDTTPIINITFPVNHSAYNYHNLTLNFTVTDFSLQTCWKSLNNYGNVTINCYQNTTVNSSGETTIEGTNNLTLWANDSTGMINSQFVTFDIHTGIPAITLNAPTDGALLNNKIVNLSFTPVDDMGLLQCDIYTNTTGTWSVNNTFIAPASGVLESYLINVSDGKYIWNVKCTDTFTNIGWHDNNHTFIIDSTPPNLNMTSPLNQSYNTIQTIINSTITDDGELSVCWYSLNSGTTNTTITCGNNVTGLSSNQGGNNWTVYANDTLNNINISSVSFFVDSISPIITIHSPQNATYNTRTIHLNVSADETISTWWYSNNSGENNQTFTANQSIVWEEGNNVVNIWANDSVGNIGNKNVTFSVLTPAPNLNLVYPLNQTYNTIQTAFNYTIGSETSVCWYTLNSGTTNITITCGDNVTGLNSGQGASNWTVYANSTSNSSNRINISSVSFFVDSINPYINITFPLNNTNYTDYLLDINITITDANLNKCWFSNNTGVTNNTFPCGNNLTNITWGYNTHIINVWVNDSANNINSSSISFTIKQLVENSFTYDTSAYETSSQTFSLNVSTPGYGTYTAHLFYNGSDYGEATKIGNNYEMNFIKIITVPISSVSPSVIKSFYWTISNGSTEINSTWKNQTLLIINLNGNSKTPIAGTPGTPYSSASICNSSSDKASKIITLRFFNETLIKEQVNASIISQISYHLSTNASINKTYSFTNTSENTYTLYCFEPRNTSVYLDVNLIYDNAESQQRIFSSSYYLTASETNPTNITSYLLSTASGLFSPFITINTVGNVLSNVKAVITRILNTETINIVTDYTDDSGYLTFFLNPDVSYSVVFSKTGYGNFSFSFIPTSETRTVTLGSTSGGTISGPEISGNTSYKIYPENSNLNNNTIYTFGFNVSSNQSITLISMNITNLSGYQLLFESNAGVGYIHNTLNTGNNTKLIGTFIIKTATDTTTISKIWNIEESWIGDYSIFRQMNLYMQYGFKDFLRLLMVIAVIVGVLIFMSSGDFTDDAEPKIAVAVLIVWAFSIVGWINTGLTLTGEGNITTLTQFANQYGVAIISTLAGAYIIIRRLVS